MYMGLPWVGSRNAMMIVLFSSGFVAFLLLVLGKTEGVLSNKYSMGEKQAEVRHCGSAWKRQCRHGRLCFTCDCQVLWKASSETQEMLVFDIHILLDWLNEEKGLSGLLCYH